jgi:hypothetical protein
MLGAYGPLDRPTSAKKRHDFRRLKTRLFFLKHLMAFTRYVGEYGFTSFYVSAASLLHVRRPLKA